jgi:hypothetical protein
MTSPAPMDDATARYTSFRVALAGGVLGSVGATLVWVVWLSLRSTNREAAVTIVLAGIIGLAVHWVQHYVETARRESRGEPPVHHDTPGRQTILALAWATGFGFVGFLTEDLVAHTASLFLRPFLASLTSFLPAGAIVAWAISRGHDRSNDNLFMRIASGLWIGALITVASGVLWTIGFGHAPWFALFSWWGLFGIAVAFVTGAERNAGMVGAPIGAVVIAFIAVVLINLLPMSGAPYQKLGPLSPMATGIRTMAAEVASSPALPATFWLEAERRLAIVTAAESPDSGTVTATPSTSAPAGDTGDTLPESIRSWVMLLLFAIGVGFAPSVERKLRPIDYPNSETYRRDMTLTAAVVVFLVAACALGRRQPLSCLGADANSARLEAHLGELLTNPADSTSRLTAGLSGVAPHDLALVSTGSVCGRAEQAVDAAVGTPDSVRLFYLFKAGTSRYLTWSPEHRPGRTSTILVFDDSLKYLLWLPPR